MPTYRSVANLAYRLGVSLDLRRTKTTRWLFGERETTTSVVSDDEKVLAARAFYQESERHPRKLKTDQDFLEENRLPFSKFVVFDKFCETILTHPP